MIFCGPHENHKIHKDAHGKIIDVGLAEILSPQAVYHLVTKWILDICGYRWVTMEIYGYPVISMDVHGYLWISMDVHGYPSIDTHIHGNPWILMDMGYVWIFMDTHQYP